VIFDDAWLSAIFGRAVFRVGTECQADALRAHAHGLPAAFYYAKVETTEPGAVRDLGAAGLAVVDVNVTLDRSPAPAASTTTDVHVDDVRPEQHAAVLDIAGRAFRYSRFHLDPLIPRALAHRVKREWIASYLTGRRGERLLVATLDGRPVGFLAVLAAEAQGKVARVIDLVATAPEAQGLGVGTALVSAFIRVAAPKSDVLRVGTQVANAPSIRLYTRLGFQVARSTYVMHAHVGPPLSEEASS
jgi:GNAT superfamily N-acetyltransferase